MNIGEYSCNNSIVPSKKCCRYQRVNQTPYIEEEQTTQLPKEKVQRTNNDLQNIHIKLKIYYWLLLFICIMSAT
jgi:phage FluMu protein Com